MYITSTVSLTSVGTWPVTEVFSVKLTSPLVTGDWSLYFYVIVQGIKTCAWEVFRAQIGLLYVFGSVRKNSPFSPLVTWIISKINLEYNFSSMHHRISSYR